MALGAQLREMAPAGMKKKSAKRNLHPADSEDVAAPKTPGGRQPPLPSIVKFQQWTRAILAMTCGMSIALQAWLASGLNVKAFRRK